MLDCREAPNDDCGDDEADDTPERRPPMIQQDTREDADEEDKQNG
jgi:hypothetical protein